MTKQDIENKQIVFINFLKNKIKDELHENWKVKAEFSTNDNDSRVIIVQEQAGPKQVYFGNVTPTNDYYMIDIFGLSIQENKNISLLIGNLIGKMEIVENGTEKWQIIIAQFTNPQAIEYSDIKRVGYNTTLQCIVNRIL